MPIPERVAGVIVAAGKSVRFGAEDKLFQLLLGKPVLQYAIEQMIRSDICQRIIVVAGPHNASAVDALIGQMRAAVPIDVVPGGGLRQDSVHAGVRALGNEIEIVLIHDGARPLADPTLFAATAAAAALSGGAIAAIPVVDTVKRVVDGSIVETLSRDGLWLAQTPQAFRCVELLQAFSHAEKHAWQFSDEASLFERLGYPVDVVPGSPANIKVTSASDIPFVEALLRVLTTRERV